MLIYFTNNHMLGLNYVSEFACEEKQYDTLGEFIADYGTNPQTLKLALMQRIQSNVQIAGYFRNQYGDFCHITEQAMDSIRYQEDYSLTSSDYYLNNILGQVYTEICPQCNKPKKVKKQKEDRFEKMLMKSYNASKKQNWYRRINQIFFCAKYEQIW